MYEFRTVVSFIFRVKWMISGYPMLFPEDEANNNSEILHFTMKMKLTKVLKSSTLP
jgi:hypothetical protein